MKAANDIWVKVKILKHIISIYGTYFPGMTATIPKRVAMNWVKNGIAVAIDDDGNAAELMPEELMPEEEAVNPAELEEEEEEEEVESGLDADTLEGIDDGLPEIEPEPEVETKEEAKAIPAGMYFCTKCQSLHRANSKTGKKHWKFSATLTPQEPEETDDNPGTDQNGDDINSPSGTIPVDPFITSVRYGEDADTEG